MTVRVHPTAIVEDGAELGVGTAVWDNAHLRAGAVVGRDCIVGGKSYLAEDVRLGDRVKVNANVYICAGVTVETGVMLSAYTVFTNDRYPRATTPDLAELRGSGVDEHTELTTVREGATVGARSVIGPGLTIGRFAMVGMGSTVTKDVHDFHLVVGAPARSVGAVCRCGLVVARWAGEPPTERVETKCDGCGLGYEVVDGEVRECDG
jgi:acetyltransferase-like isoleucine patch superfamily enzyme